MSNILPLERILPGKGDFWHISGDIIIIFKVIQSITLIKAANISGKIPKAFSRLNPFVHHGSPKTSFFPHFPVGNSCFPLLLGLSHSLTLIPGISVLISIISIVPILYIPFVLGEPTGAHLGCIHLLWVLFHRSHLHGNLGNRFLCKWRAGQTIQENHWKVHQTWNHRVIMVGKESQDHQSNLSPNIPISTQPHNEGTRLLLSWMIPGMATPPQPAPGLNHSVMEEISLISNLNLLQAVSPRNWESPCCSISKSVGPRLSFRRGAEKKCFPGICRRMPEARTKSHQSRTLVGTRS